jgi:hypothetical protein
MKLIELGRVTSVSDPLGIGRIRVEYLDRTNSAVERSVPNYKPWDELDPFVFHPLLPVQINVVPEINQLVKLFYWDTDNTQNREYLSGPFVNSYDTSGQGIDRQLQSTSRGVRIIREASIFKPNGDLVNATTKGVIANPSDIVHSGNYGSDIILSRNGVTLRAGKIDDDKYRKTKVPVAYNKLARISIKKYDQTIELVDKDIIDEVLQHKPLNVLVEYSVNDIGSLNNLFDGQINIYRIITPVGGVTDTLNFDQNKEVADNNKALIYSRSISGVTLEEMGRDFSQELRIVDMSETQRDLNPEFFSINTHPFYYKPSKLFLDSLTTQRARDNANKLYGYINLASTRAYGLSYSSIEKDVPIQKEVRTITVQNKIKKPTTIATLLADVVYRVAFEANVPNDSDKINFAKLNNYELTQEEILEEIFPKSYSEVRGEPLLYLLELMIKWMVTHVHNPAEPGIGPEGLKEELIKELQSAKDKIINQKLRIN